MTTIHSTAPEVSLRVLTVNAHKGFAFMSRRFMLHELREAVRAVGADLVFLQEVQGAHRRHPAQVARWPAAPQHEFLADAAWPEFAYGRNAVYLDGDHGNALLSKFPILEFENRDVSIAGQEARGLLHCSLRLPGRNEALHAICVHLGLKEAHRRRQLAQLGDVIRVQVPASAPLVVAGDFNDWRARAHRTLAQNAGLHEVFVEANGRAAKTFPARWPVLPLDRIYVKNMRAERPLTLPRRPWHRLSDHAPLAAELRL